MMPFTATALSTQPERSSPKRIRIAQVGTDAPTIAQLPADNVEMPSEGRRKRPAHPQKILVIDIGGTNMKLLASGQEEPRKTKTGKTFTPHKMVEEVRNLVGDWEYEAIALGYPGQVDESGPILEPGNLGKGWIGFDFAAALERPVKIINDAAMQALGSYEGGRMLFIGLGTGVGSALVSDATIIPLELGQLPFREGRLSDYLKKDARKKNGHGEWEKAVKEAVAMLRSAFTVDYITIGGGNARKLTEVPGGARLGKNENAFLGGFRIWNRAQPKKRNLGIPRLKRPSWRTEWRVV